MFLIFLALNIHLVSGVKFYEEPLTIPEKKEQYEFWLDVNRGLTMGDISDGTSDGAAFIWDSETRQLQVRDNHDCSVAQPVIRGAVTADGLHRRFIAVNNSLPGPTLVVWEGAEVVVHVRNNLETESVAVHFHGQIQKGTFWYDGAGNINQCPIRPGETFTYRFRAEPSGTFFYHGHFMGDRGDGLVGAFVVLSDRDSGNIVQIQDAEIITQKQFVINLQDWFSTETMNEFMYGKWGLKRFRHGWERFDVCYHPSRTYDGGEIGKLMWHAALINGRGWHDVEALKKMPDKYPLSRFRVRKHDTILMRVINSGILFPLVFSVQHHRLRVIASDGNPIKPVMADYVVVMPGERYDVILERSGERTMSFIVSQTVEIGIENRNHFALAILEYGTYPDGQDLVLPNISFPPEGPCVGVNCPFEKFATLESSVTCVNFDSIEHGFEQARQPKALNASSKNLEEHFLNIYVENNVAGRIFTYPKAPPALFPKKQSEIIKSCDHCGRDGSCRCTQQLNLKKDSVVQLVFYNRGTGEFDLDDLDASAHPMHIHGHHFYVVHVGYAKYNSNTGQIESFNDDLKCVGDDGGCNVVEWMTSDPVFDLSNPPLKDTITVPVGGYVVLRFLADNPGVWIGHCHVLPHHLEGMAILIKEGEFDEMPKRPLDFPQCYVYSDSMNLATKTLGRGTGLIILVGLWCLFMIDAESPATPVCEST